ncbi:MAG: TetR/AcrR family transcriptional regulator [Bacteroidales bacterium]
MNKKEYTKEEITHSEVVQAARQLFQQYGLVKTTMEDIARKTGRGKSTLYYYFKNKEEIFEAVVGQELAEALADIEAATSACPDAIGKISAFIHTTTETLKSKANLYAIAKGELRDNPQLMAVLKTKLDSKEIMLIKSIILSGVETGEFKPGIAQQADIFSFLMVSTLRSLSLEILTSEIKYQLDESFNILTDILLNGIKNQ